MTELEQASTAFFKAILKTGAEILGHPEFMFKIDCSIGSKPEDFDRAKLIGMRVQEALDVAKEASKPVTIEGTSLQ
jgi:hypothetical protein